MGHGHRSMENRSSESNLDYVGTGEKNNINWTRDHIAVLWQIMGLLSAKKTHLWLN